MLTVASHGEEAGVGADHPVTPSRGWHPNLKKNVAEFTKNTGQHDVGRWELWRDESWKKGHHFVAVTKKVASFLGE